MAEIKLSTAGYACEEKDCQFKYMYYNYLADEGI